MHMFKNFDSSGKRIPAAPPQAPSVLFQDLAKLLQKGDFQAAQAQLKNNPRIANLLDGTEDSGIHVMNELLGSIRENIKKALDEQNFSRLFNYLEFIHQSKLNFDFNPDKSDFLITNRLIENRSDLEKIKLEDEDLQKGNPLLVKVKEDQTVWLVANNWDFVSPTLYKNQLPADKYPFSERIRYIKFTPEFANLYTSELDFFEPLRAELRSKQWEIKKEKFLTLGYNLDFIYKVIERYESEVKRLESEGYDFLKNNPLLASLTAEVKPLEETIMMINRLVSKGFRDLQEDRQDQAYIKNPALEAFRRGYKMELAAKPEVNDQSAEIKHGDEMRRSSRPGSPPSKR